MLRRTIVASCVIAFASTLLQSPQARAQTGNPQVSGQLGASPYSFTFSSGPDFMHFSSDYRSTGVQTPFDRTANGTGGLICGGVNGYWPMAGGTQGGFNGITYGGGINVCGVAGGKTTLFSEIKHGTTGLVTATVTPQLRTELFVGVHVPVLGPEQTNPYFFMRAGPVFAQNKIEMTSNQVPGGGVFESNSRTSWNTGLMLEGGVSSPLCRDCLGGNPLRWTISGKGYWFGSGPSVTVHSSTFGFDETANISRSSEYSINLGLSTPLKF